MPFLRNSSDINFDPEHRKKLEQIEIEKMRSNFFKNRFLDNLITYH